MREWLKQKRRANGLTQQEIATAVNISRAYYTQLELGNRDPSPKVAMKIADTLDFDWTFFFVRDGISDL